MPEISLLQPTVLRGVVQKLQTPENLAMLSTIPQTPWPYPTAKWDVIKGSRNIAKPNVPNSEAHIVPKLGISQETASFIYLREKKVFEPTTIHWVRTPGDIAARNAEAAVLREVTDLNTRFDNFAEYCIWKALSGTLTLDYPDVKATIDYKYPASHKPTVSTSWATATPAQIRDDVTAWKRLISRDSRVAPDTIFLSEPTLNYVFKSFAASANTAMMLSDRQKDTFFSTGALPGFLGMNWRVQESVYDADNGTQTLFLPDDALLMGNFSQNRPIEMMIGPSADDEAPDNFTGKFSKIWKEKDPSARQFLIEWHFLPVITRPEQFVYVSDLTPA